MIAEDRGSEENRPDDEIGCEVDEPVLHCDIDEEQISSAKFDDPGTVEKSSSAAHDDIHLGLIVSVLPVGPDRRVHDSRRIAVIEYGLERMPIGQSWQQLLETGVVHA